MFSGAGEAVAHRRRDLRSWFLLLSFFSVNLPKNPNLSSKLFFSDRLLWNGEREQCFIISLYQTSSTNLSLNRATELLHQSNDILDQTSEQYLDDTSNDSRSGPTMDVVTFPLPPPSTLTPAPPAPARRSMPSTMTPANHHPSYRSTAVPYITFRLIPWLSVWIYATKLVFLLTQNLGRPRSVSKFVQRLVLSKRTPATASNVDQPTTVVPNQISRYRRLPESMKGMTTRETLSAQMDSSFWLGLSTSGPLRILPRPVSEIIGLAQEAFWPRFLYFFYLANPSLLSSPYFVELGRRLQSHFVLTSMARLVILLATKPWSYGYQSLITVISADTVWRTSRFVFHPQAALKRTFEKRNISEEENVDEESSMEEDWKKTQVDSKKILAQPHQSAIAIRSPINLKRISKDFLHIASSFNYLSFRFISRSEISIVDDLAKKAVRSMTTGLSMLL